MSAHCTLRRRVPVLIGLFATAGASFALAAMLAGPADADASIPPVLPAERGVEAQPALRNEPLVDPRAERAGRAETHAGDIFLVPYGIERGVCDRRQLANDAFGGVVGLVGGTVASETVVSTGRGKAAYAVAGTAAGPLIGPRVGRMMDEVDHHCIGRTLEYAPDNHRVRWHNEAKDLSYVVIPVRTFQNQKGLYCREYLMSTVVAGKSLEALAAACRGSNGTWKLLRSD